MDLCETLNAKRNQEGDLRDKLNNQNVAVSGKVIVPTVAVARTNRLVPREPITRYQTLFSRDIEKMDPPEKFTPPRFYIVR